MEFLQAIQDSAFATWVRESPSIFAYTTVLSLHAMGLAIVVGVSFVVVMRVLGLARAIPLEQVLRLYRIMYIGFTLNALSGLALLAANATGMLTNGAFIAKIAFIVLAMMLMELLRGRLTLEAANINPGDVPGPTRVLGASALTAWGLVIIAGRLTAYPHFLRNLLGL
jgi:hypothetical protein